MRSDHLESERLLRTVLAALENEAKLSILREDQNSKYEGTVFQLNGYSYRMRLAKLTPKKQGYFVAVWEKNAAGKNQAFGYEQSPGKLIIAVVDGEKCGQFIFPKDVLLKRGILKNAKQKGKMAFRVYPSWIENLNETAKNTQAWQREYFIDLTEQRNIEKLNSLYF